MTAIYGLWRFDGGDIISDSGRMGRALARYGRDDSETRTGDGIELGRLARHLLPEDRFRPNVAPASRYIVMADVRLTERENLVAQLGLGETADQMSDAAIAAAAVETWHEEAFDRIYGAFAIAAWDTRERRMLLGRDHAGLRPLFFFHDDRLFAFASMPEGLRALPEVPRGFEREVIRQYLQAQPSAAGTTYYEAIACVPPGHYAVVTPTGISETRYWNPDLTPLRLRSHDDYAAALAENFDRAVAASLRGVGAEVGAQLSSGFDSSAVATSAALQLRSRGGKVVAFTGAPRDGYAGHHASRSEDESVLARATAAMHPNMEHVIVRPKRTPLSSLDRAIAIYAKPDLSLCNLAWVDAIHETAAERGITVLLEATMGNATISERGYMAMPEMMRAGRLLSWLRIASGLLRRRIYNWRGILWATFSRPLPLFFQRWMEKRAGNTWLPAARYSALKSEYWETASPTEKDNTAASEADKRSSQFEWLRQEESSLAARMQMLSSCDSGGFYKSILCEWNIDYRDPTADRRLAEFSLRIPVEQLIHEGEPRALLRKLLADRVPPEVLDNPRKGIQGADWYEWLDQAREEIAAEVARIEMFEASAEMLDVERLRALVDNWPEGGSEIWHDPATIADYRFCLQQAISVASFMRQATGSNY